MASLREEARDLALVALGAIPGALLRWRLDQILLANLLGCLLIGLLLSAARPRPRLMLCGAIGFCGSLTSFSTWILELHRLLLAGSPAALLGELLLPLGGGLLALLAGLLLGRLAGQLADRTGGRLRR